MKALLIAPMFFNYESVIKKHLELYYEMVIYKNEIPFNSAKNFYALKRISKFLAAKSIDYYNDDLIKIIDKKSIDLIFIIRGECISEKFLYHAKSKGVKIINYQWDSFVNNPNALIIADYASVNFTFDSEDANNNSKFKHLPLFYYWENIYENNLSQNISDILFVGSYHSGRHLTIRDFEQVCKKYNIKLYSYVYMPFLVYLRKIFAGEKVKFTDVKFVKLSRGKYLNLLKDVRCVLDIHSPTQTGATIRSIESLALSKKVITTNKFMKNEKFYSKENVFILGIDSIDNLHSFITSRFFDLNKKTGLLSLDEWLCKIIN